jgi:hypothetical protein
MFQQIMHGIIFDLHGVHPFGSLDGFATYHASGTNQVMAKNYFLTSEVTTAYAGPMFQVQSSKSEPTPLRARQSPGSNCSTASLG